MALLGPPPLWHLPWGTSSPSFADIHNLEFCFSCFSFFFFNWRKITSPYCVGFCHTTTWIRHKHTHITSLLSFPASPHPALLGHHRAPSRVPCVIWQLSAAVDFAHGRAFMWMLLSPFPTVSTSLFFTSASPFLPGKWVHQHHFSKGALITTQRRGSYSLYGIQERA